MLAFLGTARGQEQVLCGSFTLSPPPEGTPIDSLVFDRFGNAHHIANLRITAVDRELMAESNDCNLGYFNLMIDRAMPAIHRRTVCQVFCDLAAIILPQSDMTCKQSFPRENVNIEIRWTLPQGGAGVGGEATPFYSGPTNVNCREVLLDRPFIKINGGKIYSLGDQFDGRIVLNPNVVVNNIPRPWHTDWTTPNGPNEVDLYSVVLHEALHILGFASRINTGDEHSLYDMLVRARTGSLTNPVYTPVLVTTNSGGSCAADAINCWQLNGFNDLGALTTAVNNTCGGSQPHITVGGVPVANNAINPGASLDANLSHLNNSPVCGIIQPYVMTPGMGTGPGAERREITEAERGILCQLGYQLSSGSCNGCYNIAHTEGVGNVGATSCCDRIFTVCAGESIDIDEKDLLCNDIGTGNGGQRVTRIWRTGNPLTQGLTVAHLGNGKWRISVPSGFNNSQPQMRYTIQGCNCRLHDMAFELRVNRDCTPCQYETGTCSNLICSGNFENFTNTVDIESDLGWPVFLDVGYVGTPDILVYGTNHYVHLLSGEAINLPLKECIPPGCSLQLDMDASIINLLNAPLASLSIWGSSTRPCDPRLPGAVPIATNCTLTNCPAGYQFKPVCIPPVTFTTSWIGNNPNLQPVPQILWKNNTTEDICFLTFTPLVNNNICFDNIIVKRKCPNECGVTPIQDFSCPCQSFNIDARKPGAAVSNISALSSLPTITLFNEQFLVLDLTDCAAILGHLTVDRNLIIRASATGSELKMQPCSKITVKSGVSLEINFTNIHGCEKLWRDIFVEPGGNLTLRGNTISDAHHAVLVDPGPSAFHRQTKLNITRNIFNRNHAGIFINGTPDAPPINHTIRGNTFTCTAPLFPECDPEPYYLNTSGYIGIATAGVDLLLPQNDFSRIRNGIGGLEANLTVLNSTFTSLPGAGNTGSPAFDLNISGIGVAAEGGSMEVRNCLFNDLDHAMHSDNNRVAALYNRAGTDGVNIYLEAQGATALKAESSWAYPLRIKENGIIAQNLNLATSLVIDNHYFVTDASGNTDMPDEWGVLVENDVMTVLPSGSRVSNTRIEVTGTTMGGIRASNVERLGIHYTYGILQDMNSKQNIIELTDTRKCYLYGNGVGSYQAGNPITGFYIGSSQANAYCCNRTEYNNTSLFFTGSCTDTDLKSNYVGIAEEALICTAGTQLGEQTDKGNYFADLSGVAEHRGSDEDVRRSQFKVRNLIPNTEVPPAYPEKINTSEWFLESTMAQPDCETSGCTVPPLLPDPDYFPESRPGTSAVATSPDSDPYSATSNWENGQYVYEYMLQHPEYRGQNSVLDAFYQQHTLADDALARYVRADRLMQEVFDYTPLQQARIKEIEQLQQAQSELLNQVLTHYTPGAGEALLDSLDGQMKQMFAGGEGLREEYEALTDAFDLQKQGKALTAQAYIAALPAQDVLQNNRKAVLQIAARLQSTRRHALNGQEWAVASSIAQQCPLEGGSAVYLARALCRRNQRMAFDDAVLCTPTEGRSNMASVSHTANKAVLVPNPATGRVQVHLSENESEIAVHLCNATGIQVLEQRFVNGGTVLNLDITGLSAGMYFCTLRTGVVAPVVLKLIIQ